MLCTTFIQIKIRCNCKPDVTNKQARSILRAVRCSCTVLSYIVVVVYWTIKNTLKRFGPRTWCTKNLSVIYIKYILKFTLLLACFTHKKLNFLLLTSSCVFVISATFCFSSAVSSAMVSVTTVSVSSVSNW